MRTDLIEIVEHDEQWEALFAREKRRLEPALSHWLVAPIEHIGSTAVAGLSAKPIIDMLGLIANHDAFAAAARPLRELGWVHAPEPEDEPGRRWSWCFPSIATRTHHLHVVEMRSSAWRDWIVFRDYLRAHPEVARDYARIKIDLAQADNTDRPRYRSGKAPFIHDVLRIARQSGP